MAQLGTALIIDKLQPKVASYISIAARGGTLVTPGQSLLILEIAPAASLQKAADIAAKHYHCKPAMFMMESRVGHLVLSADSPSDLNDAAYGIAEALECEFPQAKPGKVVASELISRVDAQHAYSINKSRAGSMLVPGESFYILECQHASLALKAVNEAEKNADIKIIDFKFTGSPGRIMISGSDEDVRSAREAALTALES
jgi:hypothetical protein